MTGIDERSEPGYLAFMAREAANDLDDREATEHDRPRSAERFEGEPDDRWEEARRLVASLAERDASNVTRLANELAKVTAERDRLRAGWAELQRILDREVR